MSALSSAGGAPSRAVTLVGVASGSRHKGFDHPTWQEEQVPQPHAPSAPSKGVLGSPGGRG